MAPSLQPPAVQPQHSTESDRVLPAIYGIPLKYVSLVTLAVQNAALTLIMHTSRTITPPSLQYSAASAVLLNELLKGSISFVIALRRIEPKRTPFRRIFRDIFSSDCWKLAIPALLYVLQNNLQYVAASNLDAATFQVTYQMKILTTAAFSVLLLRRTLTPSKWLALLLLAIGVGIVQIQHNGSDAHSDRPVMNPLLGFAAVTAACFTSGLAGVYFEMVLKNSSADLWVRNVQLSLFSIPPALLPALMQSPSPSSLFRHFGAWAWATVLTQVLGGLLTAIVIKHADNILKGFATSLSILLASAASVVLFDFAPSPAFVAGAGVVLGATWLYNQPTPPHPATNASAHELPGRSRKASSALGSPVDAAAPILGVETPGKRLSLLSALSALSSPAPSRPHTPELTLEPIVHPLYTPPPTRPPSRLSTVSRSGSSLDVAGRGS